MHDTIKRDTQTQRSNAPCFWMASRLLLGRSGRRIKEQRPGPAEEETSGGVLGDGICRERQATARPEGDGRSEAWRGSRMRARRSGRRCV